MTAYSVDVQNDAEYAIDLARLREAAMIVLAQHEVEPESALTVVVTTDEEVARLNREFRGVDAPTDVLSFRADMLSIEGEAPYLGDLIVAFPYASAQAARESHDLGDSLALLVVHGALHLIGYDHDTPAARAAMWAAQDTALRALGVPLEIVPALEGEHGDDKAED
jgi:probable rRNA maturation factor